RNGQARLLLGRLEGPLPLELGQDLPRACDDARWQAGQRGDVNSIGAIRATRHHAVQESNRLSFLEHLDTLIADPRQPLRKSGELVIVRREQGAAAEPW